MFFLMKHLLVSATQEHLQLQLKRILTKLLEREFARLQAEACEDIQSLSPRVNSFFSLMHHSALPTLYGWFHLPLQVERKYMVLFAKCGA